MLYYVSFIIRVNLFHFVPAQKQLDGSLSELVSVSYFLKVTQTKSELNGKLQTSGYSFSVFEELFSSYSREKTYLNLLWFNRLINLYINKVMVLLLLSLDDQHIQIHLKHLHIKSAFSALVWLFFPFIFSATAKTKKRHATFCLQVWGVKLTMVTKYPIDFHVCSC